MTANLAFHVFFIDELRANLELIELRLWHRVVLAIIDAAANAHAILDDLSLEEACEV